MILIIYKQFTPKQQTIHSKSYNCGCVLQLEEYLRFVGASGDPINWSFTEDELFDAKVKVRIDPKN